MPNGQTVFLPPIRYQTSLFQEENRYQSLIFYPGSKRRAIASILPHIPSDEKVYCSPFVGGAFLELAILSRKRDAYVYAYDNFEPLVNFWQHILDPDTQEQVADLVEVIHDQISRSPCSMEEFCKEGFKNLRAYYWTLQCPISKAAYFFVLNRISTLGMTFRANNSNIDKMRELNSFALQRLRDFKIKNFEVDLADYVDSIARHPDAFLYLDPPYISKEAYYGSGSVSKFDHNRLADILKNRNRWVLSYGDHPKVRELYREYQIFTIRHRSEMRRQGRNDYHELLIISH